MILLVKGGGKGLNNDYIQSGLIEGSELTVILNNK